MEHRGWEQNQVLGRYLVWHIPLAVQFWPIYSIRNELNKSVNEVWDGQCLKLFLTKALPLLPSRMP